SVSILLGWWTGSTPLISVFPHWTAIQPMTAVGLGLAGGGLAAAGCDRPIALRLLGAGLAAIGAMSLLAYAARADLRLDLLLFRGAVLSQDPMPAKPGRPSLLTCGAFVLLGPALMLARTETRPLRLAGVTLASLGLAAAGLSLMAALVFKSDPL